MSPDDDLKISFGGAPDSQDLIVSKMSSPALRARIFKGVVRANERVGEVLVRKRGHLDKDQDRAAEKEQENARSNHDVF